MIKMPVHQQFKYVYALFAFAGILFLVTLSVTNKSHLPIFTEVFNLIFFLTVPGYLLTRILKLRGKFGPILGYSVVLSISFLIFFGLLINNLLPVFHIYQPLSTFPFLLTANIALMVMFIIILINSGVSGFTFKRPNFTAHYLSWFFAGIAMLFPVFTGLGSNLLNNGGSNILTLIGLFGLAIYLIAFIIVRKRLQDFVFPFSIYFIGLSLLFMYSIRSPNLMGWDVQTEYKVFQLTKVQYLWTVLNYHNAYNATLGITILPTLLTNLIEIKDIFIFKIIYPIIFSFSGIGVFYIFKRYVSRTAAFLAAFFVVIQVSYASMPSLARQEIAYLAFVFIILALFDKVNRGLSKHALFLILASTIVVSHYTTTYITVGLFVSAYIAGKLLQLFYHIIHKYKPKFEPPPIKLHLFGLNVLYMVLLTIFWYGIYTNASSNIQNFLKSAQQNISKIHTQEGRSGQSWITVTGKGRNSTTNDLESYKQQFVGKERSIYMYPDKVIENYQIFQMPREFIPFNNTLKQIPDLIGLIDKQTMKILILSGLTFVVYLTFIKRKTLIDTEIIIMSILYVSLIVLVIFIPTISAQYNIERLYQQGLVFLSVYPLIVILFLYPKIRDIYKYIFYSFFIIIYIYTYHGIITQYFGGYPTMNLNNYGTEYYGYYIHDSELTSAKWINENRNIKSFIHADVYAELRLSSATSISSIQKHLIPAALWRDSYVYSSYENTTLGRVQIKYNTVLLLYNYPKQFLKDNKDTIYSNKVNEIYK